MCGPALEALRWMLRWDSSRNKQPVGDGAHLAFTACGGLSRSACCVDASVCVCVGDCAFAQRVRTWPFDVCVCPWYRRYAMGFGVHCTLLSHITAVKACRDASACAAICGDDLRGLRRHRE